MTPPELALPPAFAGNSAAFAIALFFQMMTALLAIEWTWRTAWAINEHRHPLMHPATMLRVITLLVLVSFLMLVIPVLVFNMRYPELSAAGRLDMNTVRAWSTSLALVPFSAAWLIDRLTGGMIVYQLERRPLPLHLWPTWRHMRKPLKLGVGVAFLAAALAFLR